MKSFFEKRACLKQEEITDYINEQLTHEEVIEIESHLIDCELCDNAIEGYISINNEEEKEEAKVIQLQSNKKTYSTIIRAAAIFTVFAGSVYVFNLFTPSDNNAFAYYEPMPNILTETVRGDNDTTASFYSAMIAYDRQDYTTALKELQSELILHPNNDSIRIFKAISAIETKQFSLALEELNKINSPVWENEKRWYKSLVLLKLRKPKEAKLLLVSLSTQTESFYSRQAQKLLQEL